MAPVVWWIAFAIIADGLIGLAGGLLPEAWLSRYRPGLLGFAAGALLGTTLLDILPAVLSAGAVSIGWACLAFALMFLVGGVPGRHRHHPGGASITRSLPFVLLASDALHNIADGAAIAAAFLVSPRLGVIASVGVIAHELPEEIADYVALRSSGMGRRHALLALAAVQLSAAFGAAGVLLAWSVSSHISGVVLALSGGTFAYVAASLLVHALGGRPAPGERRSAVLGLVGGVALLALMGIRGL